MEEPHRDGCPHWHLLVWVLPEQESELRYRLGNAFGSGVGLELAAIDRQRGSGTSYLVKYISPSYLSGYSEEGATSAKETAARYDAHRAVWGGRCIQFFDLPGSSTIWDEMRRIKPATDAYGLLSPEALRLHAAAVGSDYGAFLSILADMRAKPAGRVAVVYGRTVKGARLLFGLDIDGTEIQTRTGTWVIKRRVAGEQ